MHSCPPADWHEQLSPTFTSCTAGEAHIPPIPAHPPCQGVSSSTSKHSSSFFKVAVDKCAPASYNWRVLRLLKCSPGLWVSACQLSAPLVLCSLRGKKQHVMFIPGRYCSVASSLLCSAGHLLLKALSATLVFSWGLNSSPWDATVL